MTLRLVTALTALQVKAQDSLSCWDAPAAETLFDFTQKLKELEFVLRRLGPTCTNQVAAKHNHLVALPRTSSMV